MVAEHEDCNLSFCEFVLAPNRSMSWRGNLVCWGTLALISLPIALLFALQGLWLVLPFAGLELGVFLGALYVCNQRTWRREIIRIDATAVVIQQGCFRCEVCERFQRPWTRFVLTDSAPGRAPRLWIRSGARNIELGAFLNEREKRQLVAGLRRYIGRVPVVPPA